MDFGRIGGCVTHHVNKVFGKSSSVTELGEKESAQVVKTIAAIVPNGTGKSFTYNRATGDVFQTATKEVPPEVKALGNRISDAIENGEAGTVDIGLRN